MSATEWEWVGDDSTMAEAPRADRRENPAERVTAHWVNDMTELEYRTTESDETYLRTDTPVLSLQNYR